ncbi:MAG: helix-turn-helix transcriptional regulator [Actinobacteria bacterium]|nr:helix-turn-helix transcriptional regulator [Actinomycetota bacterium]
MSDTFGYEDGGGAVRSTRLDERLAEATVESLAEMLRILSDPTRIRLIEMLNTHGGASVGVLATYLPVTRQGVSRQLGILHRAGLVNRRREGMSVSYELADWTGWWLIEQLAGELGDARD